MKKILLGIAVFFTTAILCIVSAGAETFGDYTYTVLGDGTVEITEYNGESDAELVIPSELDGKKVTSIGEAAFGFAEITSVTIPDGVTSIGDKAFRHCTSLETVSVPDSVKTIGNYAFNECGALALINIPQGVASIGDYAFWYCYTLASIEFPASVTSIGEDVFAECYGLEEILVDSANKNYASVDGVLFNKNMTELIMYPSAKAGTSYIVPSTVTKLGGYAFADCIPLTSITLPEGLTKIGHYAFYWCENLKTITIPEKVTTIGDYAFWYDCSLTDIEVDADNKNYASVDGVLYSKDMTEIVAYPLGKTASSYDIPDGVKTIANGAFTNAAEIETITIPAGVTSIGDYAFSDCATLKAITIPDGVISMGDYAFAWCHELKSADIADSVKSIGEYCFDWCYALETANVPKGITVIEDFTFGNCKSLKSIIIPDGVTSIGEYSFNTCRALTSVVIPDSVTSIGEYAFLECECLESITIPDSVTEIDETAFNWCDSLVISCFEGSYAQEYATANEIEYKLITPYIAGFKASSRNYNSITLSWNKRDTVTGYVLQTYKDGAWVNLTNIKDNTITSYKVTDLTANTSYKFRAVAYVTKDGATNYSKYTSALTVSTAPAMTTGFAITGRGSDFLTVSWTKNVGATGYIIQEQIDGVWTKVVAIKGNTTTSYKITGLQPNSFHRYRMVAYKTDANGTCYGKYTGSAPGYTAPAMVSGFKVSDIGTDSLTVSWTKVPSANGYVIDIYKNGAWSQLAKITSNATTSYKASGLTLGTTYKFRIKSYAVNSSLTIYSTYSSAISETPGFPAPANLKMTNRGTDFISVRWDKNESADGYMVYIYDGTKWTCVKTLTSASSVSHKITGLESGKTYKITVKAYKTVDGTKLISDTATISANTL